MTYYGGGPGPRRVTFAALPPGDAGIWRTVRELRRLALEGARSPEVRAWLPYVGRTPLELRAWLAAHTRYEDDPPGLELVRAAPVQLDEIEAAGVAPGDCDDVAVLAAALACARGWRVRLRLADFGLGWEHVWAEARAPGGRWVELDVQRPAATPYGAGIRSTAEVRV